MGMGESESSGWGRELDDLTRAFSGACIFGIPLLFTMEMWWIGKYADPWKLIAFLLVALVANFGFTYAAGFKRERGFRSTINNGGRRRELGRRFEAPQQPRLAIQPWPRHRSGTRGITPEHRDILTGQR